jgi:Tfp pilus assembly protein PilV
MLGISVHGLVGVDAELRQSTFAARQQQQQHMVGYDSVRVIEHYGDCPKAPPPQSRTRS